MPSCVHFSRFISYLCRYEDYILGTGTSQGVPVIGCKCEVCRSEDRRDRRLRTSAMIEVEGKRFIIDAGPDFRYQMLREGVTHIDAILLTHMHKDHTAGIDDVRAFNFVDYPTIHSTHIYGNEATINRVKMEYDYAFVENKYRGVPVIELHTIDTTQRGKNDDTRGGGTHRCQGSTPSQAPLPDGVGGSYHTPIKEVLPRFGGQTLLRRDGKRTRLTAKVELS